MGSHARRHSAAQRSLNVWTLAAVVPLLVATVVAMVILWPTVNISSDNARAEEFTGVVTSIAEVECPPAEADGSAFAHEVCGTAEVDMEDGPDGGTTVTTALPTGTGAPTVDTGDSVTLILSASPDGNVYSIVDHQRGGAVWILLLAFALAVIAFGRWRGVTALIGLALTFGVLVVFVVPAILSGSSPLLVASVGAAAIVLTVLYLTHGFSPTTTVALFGTVGALVLTGLLATLAVGALHLTGVTDDSATFLDSRYSVDMRGLLLAAIIIGSLGVLDDVTVSQAATVAEVARANRGYGFRELYRAGARVGRSHVASVINTIVLAYAGSSLPLLVLIIAYTDSFSGVLTDQVIAQELARSATATIGLVAAVPLTTALAAWVASRSGPDTLDPDVGHGHGHGHGH